MTAYTVGVISTDTMTITWACPACQHEGSIDIYRVYRDMRIFVYCAECGLGFLVITEDEA